MSILIPFQASKTFCYTVYQVKKKFLKMGTICVTFLFVRKNKKLLMERSFIETGPRKQSCIWLLEKWIDGFFVISIFLQRLLL